MDKLLLHARIECPAGQQTHHDVRHRVLYAKIVDRDDMRVFQPGHNFRFAGKTLPVFSLRRKSGSQYLDRNFSFKIKLITAINCPHTSRAEQFLDLILS